jgi:hypothetical protein
MAIFVIKCPHSSVYEEYDLLGCIAMQVGSSQPMFSEEHIISMTSVGNCQTTWCYNPVVHTFGNKMIILLGTIL